MVNYPGSLDDGTSLYTVADDVDDVLAAHREALKTAIIAIETKVGITGSENFATDAELSAHTGAGNPHSTSASDTDLSDHMSDTSTHGKATIAGIADLHAEDHDNTHHTTNYEVYNANIQSHVGSPPTDSHHDETHILASALHTATGLTAGYVLRASAATTFAWAQLKHSDLDDDETTQHFLQSGITTVGTLSAGDVRTQDSVGQIGSKVSGDIFYWTSSLQRLEKGSDSDVLTLASGVPSWAEAGAPGAHASAHETGGGDLVSHDDLTDFASNEHIDWTNAASLFKTSLSSSSIVLDAINTNASLGLTTPAAEIQRSRSGSSDVMDVLHLRGTIGSTGTSGLGCSLVYYLQDGTVGDKVKARITAYAGTSGMADGGRLYLYTANSSDVLTAALAINEDQKTALALGTYINEFSTDDTLVGDSDDAVPTEQAVKSYVDDLLSGQYWIGPQTAIPAIGYALATDGFRVHPATAVDSYMSFAINLPRLITHGGSDKYLRITTITVYWYQANAGDDINIFYYSKILAAGAVSNIINDTTKRGSAGQNNYTWSPNTRLTSSELGFTFYIDFLTTSAGTDWRMEGALCAYDYA